MKFRHIKYLFIFWPFTIGIISSCKKLVAVDPPATSLTQTNVFSTDATAAAVLTGLYTNMAKNSIYSGSASISFYCGLSADELTLWNGVTNSVPIAYYKNALLMTTTSMFAGSEFWAPTYRNIFICNSAIEGLNGSSADELSSTVRQQLLGEAKFMRAFYYFYLVNLFGDVPLALTSDYSVNASMPRTPKTQIWQQIITDLKEAQNLLNSNFVAGDAVSFTTERVRPTKWAATALLARAYLYTADYSHAEEQATNLINNSSQFSLANLNGAFLKNSSEAIWQLQSVGGTGTTLPINTFDGFYYTIPSTGPSSVNAVYLSPTLLSSFEAGDLRGKPKNWIDTIRVLGTLFYYPYKYKSAATGTITTSPSNQTEYLMVLRLAEQYLIRAEARAQTGSLSGAASDLNVLRGPTRANLPLIIPTTLTAMLIAILHERQVELFSEWGHRWLDLKRTGKVDEVMTVQNPLKWNPVNPNGWQSYQQYYPIPQTDITANPNLVQNTGY